MRITEREATLRLAKIQVELRSLVNDMTSGGWEEDSLGVIALNDISDTIHDELIDFADSADMTAEVFPDNENN